MQIIGAIVDFNKNNVEVRWNAEFFPSPRFSRHNGDCQPLGFFGKFDLYAGVQNPLSPILIARYGNGSEDYETFGPSLMGTHNVHQYGVHFVEALRRALFVNYDIGLK